MSITRATEAGGVAAGLPFRLAGDADGVCLISGMPALDADGRLAPADFWKTERAWRNIASIVEAPGYSHTDGEWVVPG